MHLSTFPLNTTTTPLDYTLDLRDPHISQCSLCSMEMFTYPNVHTNHRTSLACRASTYIANLDFTFLYSLVLLQGSWYYCASHLRITHPYFDLTGSASLDSTSPTSHVSHPHESEINFRGAFPSTPS